MIMNFDYEVADANRKYANVDLPKQRTSVVCSCAGMCYRPFQLSLSPVVLRRLGVNF